MKKKFSYPDSCMRIGCNAMLYCKTALENYLVASSCMQDMKDAAKELDMEAFQKQEDQLHGNLAICIVFSCMCLESFFNNYLAACLGDGLYYKNFDSLNEIQKLELICSFIFGSPLDKSQAMYCYLAETNKLRNDLVHNKSISFDFNRYVADAPMADNPPNVENPDEQQQEMFASLLVEYANEIKAAHKAIKLIGMIACFFDENDPNVHAKSHLFMFSSVINTLSVSSESPEMKELVSDLFSRI